MFERLNEREIASLSRLKRDADFNVLVEWMQRSLQRNCEDSSLFAEEHKVRWAQGWQQAVRELIGKVNDADKAAANLKPR